MSDHDFHCGDILRCVSRYHAEQLNIVGQQGIVMGAKPNHIHLWFELQKRSFWINADILRRVEDPELSPLLKHIRTISFTLDAEEWELEETDELYKLLCYVNEVPFETLQEVRSYLDFEYHSFLLGPEGMGRMIAQLEWAK